MRYIIKKQNGGNMEEAMRRIEEYDPSEKSLDLTELDLTHLPEDLPEDLETLFCSYNKLKEIIKLPINLKKLYCGNNTELTEIKELPKHLEEIQCASCNLKSLPELPNSLIELYCTNNKIESLPNLPESLQSLVCFNNKLRELPNLPNHLNRLICYKNKIRRLPNLPNGFVELSCSENELVRLPELPNSLENLECKFNRLNSLPELPTNLRELNCENNNLKKLPLLPASLEILKCQNNDLPEEYNFSHYFDEIDDEELLEEGEGGEQMLEYIEKVRQFQYAQLEEESHDFSLSRNLNNNAQNYIMYEPIENNDKMVNLPRSKNKYNSNYKKYLKYNTWKNAMRKKPENPETRYKFAKKNIKYYTAKIKKGRNSATRKNKN